MFYLNYPLALDNLKESKVLWTGHARVGEYVNLSVSMKKYLFLIIYFGDTYKLDSSSHIIFTKSLDTLPIQNFINGDSENGTNDRAKTYEIFGVEKISDNRLLHKFQYSGAYSSGEILQVDGIIEI